jgi:predicted nucleotidyltransferase
MAATKREVWGSDLPVDVVDALDEFASASIDTFGDTLKSILLFGSAAEGRMRATSDVNVLMVFSGIDVARVEAWRAQVESLAAAIDLKPLVLLEDEIAAAAEAFAVKYFDILHRRRVLHGSDPFASLSISKEALGRRVQQVLLNRRCGCGSRSCSTTTTRGHGISWTRWARYGHPRWRCGSSRAFRPCRPRMRCWSWHHSTMRRRWSNACRHCVKRATR